MGIGDIVAEILVRNNIFANFLFSLSSLGQPKKGPHFERQAQMEGPFFTVTRNVDLLTMYFNSSRPTLLSEPHRSNAVGVKREREKQ